MSLRQRGRATTGRPGRNRLVAIAVAAALALTALALTALGLARTTLDTGAGSFLPGGAAAATAQEVAAAFGGDPVVVLLETDRPGLLISPDELAKLLALEGRLATLPDVAAVYGPATVLNQIAGRAQDLLTELVGHRDGLYADAVAEATTRGAGPAGAQAAGRAATAEFDLRYGALLAQGLPAGLPTLRNDTFVRTVVEDGSGTPRPQWRFVLPRADAASVLVRPREGIDQAAAERLVDRVRATAADAGLTTRRVTVSGVPVLSAAMAATLRTEAPVLAAAAVLAVGLVLVLTGWTGRRHRLLPLASTALAAALTLATFGLLGRPLTLPVVAVLPILFGVGSDFMTYLESGAGRRTAVTVGLATATAFGALAITPLRAVQDLGMALALGTLFALGTALALARLTRGSARPPEPQGSSPGPEPAPVPRRRRAAAGIAAGCVVILGGLALPSIALRADIGGFAAGLPALADAEHVEDVIGSGGELTLAVSGPDVLDPGSLAWMQQIQDRIVSEHGDQVRPVISPATLLRFLGGDPTPGQLVAAMRLLPDYLTRSVVRSDGRLAVMTFAVRLDDAETLLELRNQVLATVSDPPPGVRVAVTGLPMDAVTAFDAISEGRYLANLLGIGAAGLVVLVGLRSPAQAARAAGTAVLATAAGLIAMTVTGTAFTPVTVALGSLTAAVGCEFAVVLTVAARRRDARLRRAVRLAAAASVVGYAVLGFSRLAVVSEFGILLAGSVVLAYTAAGVTVWLFPPRATAGALAVPSVQHRPDKVGVPA